MVRYATLHSSYVGLILVGALFLTFVSLPNLPSIQPYIRVHFLPLPFSYTLFRVVSNLLAALFCAILARGVYVYLRPPPSLDHLDSSQKVLLGLPADDDGYLSSSSSSSSSSSAAALFSRGSRPSLSVTSAARPLAPYANWRSDDKPLPYPSVGATLGPGFDRSLNLPTMRRHINLPPSRSAHQLLQLPRESPYESISPNSKYSRSPLDATGTPYGGGTPSQLQQLKRSRYSDQDVRMLTPQPSSSSFVPSPLSSSIYGSPIEEDARFGQYEHPPFRWISYRPSTLPQKPASVQQEDKFGPSNRDAHLATLKRLGITPTQLDTWCDRMRMWMSEKILIPLVACIDSCPKDNPDLPTRPVPCANRSSFVYDNPQLSLFRPENHYAALQKEQLRYEIKKKNISSFFFLLISSS